MVKFGWVEVGYVRLGFSCVRLGYLLYKKPGNSGTVVGLRFLVITERKKLGQGKVWWGRIG